MNYILIFVSLLAFRLSICQNILISEQNFPNEPSITMDPKNPANLIAGSNLNNIYISKDTGRTWVEDNLTSSYGVWGDPVIAVDTAGHFYYFHLSNPQNGSWIDRIVCQKTTDIGDFWSDGSYAGLNGSKDQDKHWVVVDPQNNNIYMTWTQFDDYGSTLQTDSSHIMFSKSLDAGLTWSAAKRIDTKGGNCLDEDDTVEGAVPAVGTNGEIYVSWAGPQGIVFNKSYDQGMTWLPKEISVDDMPSGWDYSIPGIFRANGLPVTKCDLSAGPNRGTIYINWSDQRNGATNTDIWISKSIDQGLNWTLPIKVNGDNTNRHQFFTWMTIDQTSGFIYILFYDRRNYSDTQTDVYLAISKDGAQTFENIKVSESPFIPDAGIFFGDYTNITASNGIVRPIWTRLHNGKLSLWTHLYNENELSSSGDLQQSLTSIDMNNFPNPSKNISYISYKLHQKSEVSLYIYDINGTVVKKIIDRKFQEYGKFVETIDVLEYGLKSGMYFIVLSIDKNSKTIKHVVID
ncbi:MAG: T9SS type A sorting domain-containing protein [Saprospiraceae bacterium]|nr:T9SS type A sorting domain-containing protein [Saprospiraceae bacterium]